MKKIGCFHRLSNQQPSAAIARHAARGLAVACVLALSVAVAHGQTPGVKSSAPVPEPMSVPDGYTAQQSVDLGGHATTLNGSAAMYSTLVNIQSGPRILGARFELRSLPGKKNNLVDTLTAVGSGFGGDPYDFARLSFTKGKLYEFSGIFRRDRQYFDYDLLGNPNINTGLTITNGPSNPTPGTTLAWPQVMQSPEMFNTVRRMTDTHLTLFPLAKVTLRVGYSRNTFEGPSLSPGESVGKANNLLEEYQRNSTDDFTGAIEWKPIQGTKLTFEEQIDHYKADSYFTLAPSDFLVQEADGTPVSLGGWDGQSAYSVSSCNTGGMGTGYTSSKIYTLLSPAQTTGGLPVINAACDVVTSYLRTQPTRTLFPTESFRLQSNSLKNISMNGDFHYTQATMKLASYNDAFNGFDFVAASKTAPSYGIRSNLYTGSANAKRNVMGADYGVVWQATKDFSLADQIDYSNVHQPGNSNISAASTMVTPEVAFGRGAAAAPNPTATINYTGALIAGPMVSFSGGSNGVATPAYFGQRFITNNLTGTWDGLSRATFSLTYRYRTHMIAENDFAAASGSTPVDPGGNPGNIPIAAGATTNGTVIIHEHGGIFSSAWHPTNQWTLNGSIEAIFADNAFTPVGARQTWHYRVHTNYRPKPWATVSAAYSDLERHNNTNNNQATVALFTPPSALPAPNGTAASGTPYIGPLQHVDYSRVFSMGTVLTPNEHYGLDLNYGYSYLYASTNICYLNGAAGAAQPGAVQTATSTPCPYIYGRGASAATEISGAALEDWFAKDFMKAPTEYVSAAFMLSPNEKIHYNLGYRMSDVNGSRFFNDARDVNGSLHSNYQTPFASASWTIRKGLVWKGEYNYFSYGEAGPSGSPYCSTTTSATATVVPCTSATLTGPTGLTEPSSGLTAPRAFRANEVTISMHYDF